jgi:hypothetical protein
MNNARGAEVVGAGIVAAHPESRNRTITAANADKNGWTAGGRRAGIRAMTSQVGTPNASPGESCRADL